MRRLLHVFQRTESRLAFRVHDLRGTFVTLALASGRSETWVCDRTGHKSSDMVNRYRRQARTAVEVALGWLHPMDEAIPEIRRHAEQDERRISEDERRIPETRRRFPETTQRIFDSTKSASERGPKRVRQPKPKR